MVIIYLTNEDTEAILFFFFIPSLQKTILSKGKSLW